MLTEQPTFPRKIIDVLERNPIVTINRAPSPLVRALCLASMRALAQSATICAIRSFLDSRAVLTPPTRTRG
jgi:hypothetical protein